MPILQVLNPDYLHPGTLRDWAGRPILALLVFEQHVLAILMVADAMSAILWGSVGHAIQCQSSTHGTCTHTLSHTACGLWWCENPHPWIPGCPTLSQS